MNIEVSDDGVQFTSRGEVSVAIVSPDSQPQTIPLFGVETRYVRLAILENWGAVDFPTLDPWPGNAMVMVDEVEFHRLRTDQRAPSISAQPANRVFEPGQTILLGVAAAGTDPLSYAWRRGGVPVADGGGLSGSRTPILTLTNAQIADAGPFDVVVTNYFGSVTSRVASLILAPAVETVLLTEITATATSELPPPFKRWATNAVNGSIGAGIVWESIGVNQGFGEDRAPAITFGLPQVEFVESVLIWNGPEAPVSVKRLRVEISEDGEVFLPWGDLMLLEGTAPPDLQERKLGVETRFFRFVILENWDGQAFPVVGARTASGFAQLDEVSFRAFAMPVGPPSIRGQPQDLISPVNSVSQLVVVAGGAEPLGYQWRRNGVDLLDDGHVVGAHTSALTINNSQLSDTAGYSVIISNVHGAILSREASLTVADPPVFTMQPWSTNVHVGGQVTLAVAAQSPSPLVYQWQFNEVNLSGAMNAQLTLLNVQFSAAGNYRVLVNNPFFGVVSDVATLSVDGPASILLQPVSLTNEMGSSATFTVTAAGTPPFAYQWRREGLALADEGGVSGAQTAVLSLADVQGTDAGNYDVVVSNPFSSVTSQVAVLTVVMELPSFRITNVTATATSELASHGRYASNAVNGVKFDYGFWESAGVGFGDDRAPAIPFDLGATYRLDRFVIWNSHEPEPALKRILVEYSTDGASWQSLPEIQLAPGTASEAPSGEHLLNQLQARYIRFDILENYDGQVFPFTGAPTRYSLVSLDEIEFYAQ